MSGGKLTLPKKDAEPAPGADVRERVVLALLPVASRNSLLNPQSIVEIATQLCEYIHTGRKQDTSPDSGGPA